MNSLPLPLSLASQFPLFLPGFSSPSLSPALQVQVRGLDLLCSVTALGEDGVSAELPLQVGQWHQVWMSGPRGLPSPAQR